jgi:hypothetical protein
LGLILFLLSKYFGTGDEEHGPNQTVNNVKNERHKYVDTADVQEDVGCIYQAACIYLLLLYYLYNITNIVIP